MKYTWNKKKKKKNKIENDNRKSIISEEINGVKTLIIEKGRTHDFLGEKKFSLHNALKRSRDETDN